MIDGLIQQDDWSLLRTEGRNFHAAALTPRKRRHHSLAEALKPDSVQFLLDDLLILMGSTPPTGDPGVSPRHYSINDAGRKQCFGMLKKDAESLGAFSTRQPIQ